MDITEKNGQPSMEEILASIRRIIAEEPSDASSDPHGRGKIIALHTDASMEDHGEFELPAIFRAPAPAAPEKSLPLLGRLTDVIRGTSGSSADARHVRSGETLSADPSESNGGAGRGEHSASQFPGLSSLRPARQDTPGSDPRHGDGPFPDPARSAAPVEPPKPAAPAPSTSSWKFGRSTPPPPEVHEEIKRVMAPFKDTRFQMMAPGSETPEPANPAAPAPSPAQPSEPAWAFEPAGTVPRRVDFAAIIPAHMDLPGVPSVEAYPRHDTTHAGEAQPAPNPWAPQQHEAPHYPAESIAPMPVNPLSPSYLDSTLSRHAHQGMPEEYYSNFRPPGAAHPHEPAPTGTIEDTTADLLRPMLRQWLAENMPRMVEKALHIEVAETVKPGRKPPGQ